MRMGASYRKVHKAQLEDYIAELTRNMARAKWFMNVSVKPHKDPDYVVVIIG